MKPAIWLRMVVAFLLLCGPLFADGNPNEENGFKPYGSYHGGDIDTVSLTNGNVMLHIPLFSYPQRSGDLRVNFFLEMSSKGWHVEQHQNLGGFYYTWNWGGSGVTLAMDQGIAIERTRVITDWTDHPDWDTVEIDCCNAVTPDGSSHPLLGDDYRTIDTTGFHFNLIPSGDPFGAGDSGTVLDRNGSHYTLTPFTQISRSYYRATSGPNEYTVTTISERAVATVIEDRNGNKISGFFDGSAVGMTDTLGRSLPGASNTSDTHDCVSPYPTYA